LFYSIIVGDKGGVWESPCLVDNAWNAGD